MGFLKELRRESERGDGESGFEIGCFEKGRERHPEKVDEEEDEDDEDLLNLKRSGSEGDEDVMVFNIVFIFSGLI